MSTDNKAERRRQPRIKRGQPRIKKVAIENIDIFGKTVAPVSASAFRDDSESTGLRPDSVAIQDRLQAADMLVPGSGLGPRFSDQYRHIKRSLLLNAFGKTASPVNRGNLILVTSSVPGEGKTYTAVNLALSIAQEQDHTVLLVDCDVSKQGASRMLDISHTRGLIDVLEDDHLSVSDLLLRTDIPALSVLSAGKENEYVHELLASQRMVGLVEEMVSRYDNRVIIFDGPPVLSTPQTQVLAELVGQVVFVIEAGCTPQSVVDRALDMIPQDKAVGLVLNKVEGLAQEHDYYYGYYTANTGKSE
ncbi:MAG: AAA family ATPase [Gammaproteobacteria bacterium]|nr:AAA family ATPase [Gammaproteobacteria bacterium]